MNTTLHLLWIGMHKSLLVSSNKSTRRRDKSTKRHQQDQQESTFKAVNFEKFRKKNWLRKKRNHLIVFMRRFA
jgi:hypothetical protein